MYLGIDLGTSNSAIVGHVDGRTRLFKTAGGQDALPSAILVERGRTFVGERAYARQAIAPENVATGFKRLMGTDSPIRFAGLAWKPEECSAEVLRTLVAQAEIESGGAAIDGAVVTIPAAFNQMQSEATVRAAHAAGLERVTLLQEPIAAALASIAEAGGKDGLFLVYDLGGGTFDVALVRAVGGAVNIVAHEGVNMLGGRDFDRRIMSNLVRPWLLNEFDLPSEFEREDQFQRLVRVARYAVERAKIDLSTASTATVFAGDDDIRLDDRAGKRIFVDVEVTRAQVEELIADAITESVALCRKTLDDNGFSHDDVDRVVLIGGPSKMPVVRERVSAELGIARQQGTDPMTAVAMGAAIFAESREWHGAETARKVSSRREKVSGASALELVFSERVSTPTARLRIRCTDAEPRGSVEVRDDSGRSTGKAALSAEVSFELRTDTVGTHHFEILITDGEGHLDEGASRRITIQRTEASVSIIPATYTLAVKVQAGQVGRERNELEKLIEQGAALPAAGMTPVRAARELRGGERGAIRVEFFEQKGDLNDPELNLCIGVFELDGIEDLDPDERIRRGDALNIQWKLSDSGLLEFEVEVPELRRTIAGRNLYMPSGGHVDFEGRTGGKIADDAVSAAVRDIDAAAQELGVENGPAIEGLRRRLDRLVDELSTSVDPETNRRVSEEARKIQQEVALIKRRPENQAAVLTQEIRELDTNFQRQRRHAAAIEIDRFDRLLATAERSMRQNDHNDAERAIEEMRSILVSAMRRNPEFLMGFFVSLAEDEHLAVDRRRHTELVAEGARAAEEGNIDALRAVIGQMIDNRASLGRVDPKVADMADLLRA